ncbi:cytochrome P450 4c3-like isoform X1 [Tachypleus tridentatus]|uniref:cytochrome P450 4c3-like isoform X1 n=1 Tax=Tachypleus tridentatus TaxID=6853 RepID=UPI003FD272B9
MDAISRPYPYLRSFSGNLIDWPVTTFLLCVFISLAFIQILAILIRRQSLARLINKIPGLTPRNPFLGNVTIMNQVFDSTDKVRVILLQVLCGFSHMFDKERIFRFWIGMQPVVALYKPETVEAIFSSPTILEKSEEYALLHPWLGSGLLTSSGNKWRARRKMVTPAFHFRILEDFIVVFNEQSQILVEKLKQVQNHKWVNMVSFVTLCTLDAICESAMGIQIHAQKNKNCSYVQAVYEVGETFMARMSKPWLWPELLFALSPHGRRFRKNLKKLHDFTRKVILNRKAQILNGLKANEDDFTTDNAIGSLKRPQAFLDLLINYHLNDSSLTIEDIRDEVDTFMFEGHDTTAMGISWTLYLIGLDPVVQKKVQDELDSIFGNDTERPVTVEDTKKMKYLECAIKESLRLFPSVPFFGRLLKEDLVINGYHIPKGTTCFLFVFMLHRDSEIFPNPETYDPDRFLPQNVAGRHPYAYVPFSAGPRNCIGQRYAMMEEKVIIANILRNFNLTSLDPRDKVQLVAEMVIRPKEGLRMKITPRMRE